jgi:hypothetical protein
MSSGGAVVSLMMFVVPLLGIGILQLLWIIPSYLHFRRKGQPETAKGILIAAGIVFLLNAGCWGILMTSKAPFGR